VHALLENGAEMERLLKLMRAMRRRFDQDGRTDVLHVAFDDNAVCLWGCDRSGTPILLASIAWRLVKRVCFKDNGPAASDMIYLFARDPVQVLIVPLEATGGQDFWRHLRVRGLFPARLHERATLSMDGGYYCWPPLDGLKKSVDS
jgi:hypothetical protein